MARGSNESVGRFVKQLNAAFSSRMPREAQELYYRELCKWSLNDEEWQHALSLITSEQDLERVPTLARVYDYLKQAIQSMRHPDLNKAVILFTRKDNRRYCTRPFDISEAELKLGKLPDDAMDIHLFPLDTVNPEEDYENNPDAYPTPEEIKSYRPAGLLDSVIHQMANDMRMPEAPKENELESRRMSIYNQALQIADYDDSSQAIAMGEIARDLFGKQETKTEDSDSDDTDLDNV